MLEFSRNLAGAPAAKSSVSFVNGQTGLLEYRGIRIKELAQHSSFLETTYLLLYDELPAQTELDRFTAGMTQHRRIKYQISNQIKCLPEHGHPMDALQATVAALGMFYPARNVVDRQVQYWSTIRLIAKVPTTGPELSCKDIVAMGSEAAEHDLRTAARGATRQAERARILQALQQQGAIVPRSPSFSRSAGPASTTSSAPMG